MATRSARAPTSKPMFAEFFGKETGYCRGRGGSMHIADVEGGNLGANGIVGGGMPIARRGRSPHPAEKSRGRGLILRRRGHQ